ncbi:MAG: DUF3276 family protein [Bacteroidales bacterium]|nr:DUF3276 family protein [Bacteroidales bacterium]
MEESGNKERREEIFSRAVRAGKRTYFFDVKETRSNEYYLTITESKRRFNNEQGKFYYEKHKLFLYKEDFEKFAKGLNEVVEFIETGKIPEEEIKEELPPKEQADIQFEDLGSDDKKETEKEAEKEAEKESEKESEKEAEE